MNKFVRAYIKDNVLPHTARILQSITTGGLPQTKPELEAVYQHIFERDLEQIGAKNEFYPVGNAANYSLLYFIIRVMRELKPSSVLELGAGQTSLLFNEMTRCGIITANVSTIEHDPIWADHVSSRVSHEVRVVNLRRYDDGRLSYHGYDFGGLTLEPAIDFLVVDGPPALTHEQKYSRHCSLELLEWLNPNGFVIVVDDTERSGEVLLRNRITQKLQAKGISFTRGEIAANKRQSIFASGRFSHAAFY
jgi:hypothetical protein